MVKKHKQIKKRECILLNQRNLPARGLANAFCQVENLLFERLPDNIQHIVFLASELSIEKIIIPKYTRQVGCVSNLINSNLVLVICIAPQWGLQLTLRNSAPPTPKKKKTCEKQ